MKQNITKEQLHELSEKARENLAEWHVERNKLPPLMPFPLDDLLLSIGEMIEFLVEHEDYWTVVKSGRIGRSSMKKRKEIVNALWAIIKEILENET